MRSTRSMACFGMRGEETILHNCGTIITTMRKKKELVTVYVLLCIFICVSVAEKELSRTKTELRKACEERDSLKEDLREMKRAKHVADNSYREQAARLAAIERELEFYRQQAAQSISDRDSAMWENEQLKQANVELQASLQEVEYQKREAEEQRNDAERRWERESQRASRFEAAAKEAESIPLLKADIKEALGRMRAVEEERDRETERANRAEAELERQANSKAEAIQDAEETVRKTMEKADAIKSELEEAARQKVEILMRLSDAESRKSAAEREIVRLRNALEGTQRDLDEVTQQKVQALVELAALQQGMERGGSKAASTSSGRTTPAGSSNRSVRTTPTSSPALDSSSLPQAGASGWGLKLFGGGSGGSPSK